MKLTLIEEFNLSQIENEQTKAFVEDVINYLEVNMEKYTKELNIEVKDNDNISFSFYIDLDNSDVINADDLEKEVKNIKEDIKQWLNRYFSGDRDKTIPDENVQKYTYEVSIDDVSSDKEEVVDDSFSYEWQGQDETWNGDHKELIESPWVVVKVDLIKK